MGPVLIVGARSDIAMAAAHRFAGAGHPVQLAARGASALEADACDLTLRYGVEASVHEYDALHSDVATFVSGLPVLPQIAVCAVGLMSNQAENETNAALAATVMRSNFEGPAALLAELANRFAARGSGTLVGVSSVAGLRGRASNYVYGAAKAGFTAFLSGLRNRLAGQGVHVVTVLPGFVDTRMTEGMDLPRRLTAQPEEVAEAIFRAVAKRRDVVYVRPIWRLIMAVVCAIPERVFKKMRI
jgi:decaprenylphospho-beta-D-erythro-pentofuranosid-2-ulose 2-reductase